MRATCVATLLLSFAASPLVARDILLNPPIACDLGTDCFVQQYVDHDPTRGAMDFHCSTLSYDTHQGTDFALKTIAQMRAGVDVVPAAPGTVRATRDGMADRLFKPEHEAEMDGRDCGNGVVVDHGGGWTTQYCHLKRDSVSVKKGDRVNLTTVLGQVGLSGRTQFPHVHMTLRQGDQVVDPFDPDGAISCDAPSATTLWQTPPPYQPGGVLSAGFTDAIPGFDSIKAGTADQENLPADAPAIVLYGYVFGGRAGDSMQMTIEGPNGTLMDETVPLERNQARLFRAVGKKRTTAQWPAGTYRGDVSLVRDGKVINVEDAALIIQ